MDIQPSAAAVPADLRAVMVDQLRDWKVVHRGPAERAMREVPRHVFVPDAPLESAYGFGPIVTHRDAEGVAVSSGSLLPRVRTVVILLPRVPVWPLDLGVPGGMDADRHKSGRQHGHASDPSDVPEPGDHADEGQHLG